MSKSMKNQSAASSSTKKPPSKRTGRIPEKKQRASKQSRVIAMLQSSDGTTIAAMMKATDWQQHSVRGFLAGVVRKRLKLKLTSQAVDGKRVYRIVGTPPKSVKATRPSA